MTTITQNTLHNLIILLLCITSFSSEGQSLNNDLKEISFQDETAPIIYFENEEAYDKVIINHEENNEYKPLVDPCVFGSNEAQQGGFSIGYTASFDTNGTDVTFSFTLLDTDKIGVVAFLWEQDPFTETEMDAGPDLTFTKTLGGFTTGETISFACKFAFAGGLAVTKYFQYEVGLTCDDSTNDTEAPQGFSATSGQVNAFTAEVILNGTDNSGTVVYNIAYGSKVKSTSVASGTEARVVIGALIPETTYDFSITATDLVNNVAANSPIVVQLTTMEDTSTECEGTSADSKEGAFSVGYNYNFETNGTDVTFTFQLLDTDKIGVVAFVRDVNNVAGEVQMDEVSALTFSKTISGFTAGQVITYGCKFAFQGGLAVTKDFSYEVGNDCLLSVNEQELQNSVSIYPNPTKDILYINSSSQDLTTIEIYSLLGQQVLEATTNLSEINISTLANGVYMLKIYSGTNVISKKFLKE